MAECQDKIDYDAELLDALERSLSKARLAPYLKASNNDITYAIQRYLWNARIAKSFLFPIQVAEISVRNSIHATFSADFGGEEWIKDPPEGLLNDKTEESRQKALDRLGKSENYDPNPNEIVAALTLDFWANLFREGYVDIWEKNDRIRRSFPNMTLPYDWRFIQNRVRRVNALRNRIAHHEPVWNQNDLNGDYEKCLELIGLSCNKTKKWTQRNSTVPITLRSPPPRGPSLPGLPLTAITLDPPIFAKMTDGIVELFKKLQGAHPAAAIVSDAGAVSIISALNILQKIIKDAESLDGYAYLGDVKVEDMKDYFSRNIVDIGREATTGDLASSFYPLNTNRPKRPQFATIRHEKTGEIVGLIERPTIRFR